MDKISPIKNRALQYIDYKQISKQEFCSIIGISYSNIKGKSLKSELGGAQIAEILSNFSDLSPEWLLTGRGKMLKSDENSLEKSLGDIQILTNSTYKRLDKQAVPLFNIDALAGLTPTETTLQYVEDYISIPNIPKCDGAIHVRGNSMSPIIDAGDIVIYKIISDKINGILFGNVYILSVNANDQEHVMIKQVQRSEIQDHYKLVSYNSMYPPIDVPISSIRTVALVAASLRYHLMF